MSTTALKVIAVIAMFIDHIGYFIPNTPEWFRWIGRIAIPIFIFTLVIGFQYTSNRKNYLIRLYLFSLGMSFINLLMNYILRDFSIGDLTSNFFASLFLMAFILYFFEEKQLKLILYFFLWQVVAFIFPVILADIVEFPQFNSYEANGYFWGAILGSIIWVEGGPLFIVMGVLLYKVRSSKINLAIIYMFSSLVFFYVTYKWEHLYNIWNRILFVFPNYQWLMIVALPLILLYNNKKGTGMKYFFYIFYPLHIIILYLIGFYLMNPSSLMIISNE